MKQIRHGDYEQDGGFQRFKARGSANGRKDRMVDQERLDRSRKRDKVKRGKDRELVDY